MKNLEYKQPEPEDLGSYEVPREGPAKISRRPEVKARKFLKNEQEYERSKLRADVKADLVEEWWDEIGLDGVFNDEEAILIFTNPAQYAPYLEGIKRANSPSVFSSYLDDVEMNVKTKLADLEEILRQAEDNRLDYKNTPDKVLDKELKDKLEDMIGWVKIYISNGQKIIDSLKEERNKLLTEK